MKDWLIWQLKKKNVFMAESIKNNLESIFAMSYSAYVTDKGTNIPYL